MLVSDGWSRRTSLRLTVRCVCEDSPSFVDVDGDGCEAFARAKLGLCADPLTADKQARAACPLACGACDFDCIVTGLCTVLPPKLISSFQAWHAYRAAPPRTPRLPPPLLMPRRTRQCTALRGRPIAGAPFTPWQRRVRTDACACTTFTHQRE
jgi:hypothetical protein